MVKAGWSWPTLFFGFWVPLLRGNLAASDAEIAYMRARVPCVKHRFARANKEALWRSCMREQGAEPCSAQSCNFPSYARGFAETACRDVCAAGGH